MLNLSEKAGKGSLQCCWWQGILPSRNLPLPGRGQRHGRTDRIVNQQRLAEDRRGGTIEYSHRD